MCAMYLRVCIWYLVSGICELCVSTTICICHYLKLTTLEVLLLPLGTVKLFSSCSSSSTS